MEKVARFTEWMKGKKSYFVALAIAVVVFSSQMGWITAETANTLLALLGAGGLAAIAAKVDRKIL